MSQQLKQLAEPFKADKVGKKPGGSGGAFVSHAVVTERALSVLGPYSITNVELIRGLAPEIVGKKQTFPPIDNAVVGAIVTVAAEIDGIPVRITEVGDCENPAMLEQDGARAKNAVSDALKRCWMRAGIGLHLWSREQYTLDDDLSEPAPPPANAWADWEDRQQALSYAMHLFDRDGAALFTVSNHAANSYDKLKKAYIASLAPDEQPSADSSEADKRKHVQAVHKLWNQKLIAKWNGQEFDDPSPYADPPPPARSGKGASVTV
jgi:hypothetical protein